jgi:DNA-binding transcriptional LysR family regulator
LPDTTNLVAQPLATFQRVVVASPAYLDQAGTPRDVAALSGHAAIGGLGAALTWRFAEEGEERAITLTPRLRIGTLLGMRAAALAGLGIAVLPDFVVAEDLQSGALRQVLAAASLAPAAAHALHRVELRGARRIEAIVTHLRERMPLAPAPPLHER